MKMATMNHFLLVLCLAVCVEMCMSWVEDVAEENTDWAQVWDQKMMMPLNMKYKAEDAASRTTDTMKSAASGAPGSDEIIRMPTDNKVTEAKDTVQHTYEDAKQKLNTASDKASNMAHNAYDEVKHGMDCGGNDNTFGVYNELSEAYMSAKNSMSQEAKAKYEAAKEKASEATGNLGAKMRNTP